MPRDPQTELKLILTQLNGLKQVREDYVPERDGREYNTLVQRVSDLGYDVSDFVIAEDDFFAPVATVGGDGRVSAYHPTIVRHGVFHRKLSSLLQYIEISQNATIVTVTAPRRDN